MEGSTRLVNNSPQQPRGSFFHYPKLPSYMKQQTIRPFIPYSKRKPEPYLPMAQRDYSNIEAPKPRSSMRRAIDYSATVVRQLEARVWQRDERDHQWVQPDPSYAHLLHPPSSFPQNSSNAVTTKFVHCSTNKVRCPVFCVVWTPEGRRLVTGASSGEFTLWNGLTFNFETILQAHDYSIRSMCWSHSDLWLLSGDDMGYVKYWQSNMNNVQMFQAHKNQAIRGVSFAPTDSKFASCSDDGTVRIWDFLRCHEERIMRGHGADVRCVDWHQQRGLIVSGSKDNQQPIKLWDPRSGNNLTTIHGHKATVMAAKFSNNGNWLITASRDHLCKSFDLRTMKEMYTYRGHQKEATSLSLHPIHEDLFVSGGSDGSILFWQVENEREIGSIESAHDSMVWGLSWHPLGHMLCSGSNDHSTKFWSRNRPGDKMRDRYNLNTLPIGASEELREYDDDSAVTAVIPGMGLETNTTQEPTPTTESAVEEPSVIPGLDSSVEEFAQFVPVPQRKIAYARPVPSAFQKEWESKKAPGIAPDLMGQEKARRDRERAEQRRKDRQKDEEDRRRRTLERDQSRKREAEHREQRDKESQGDQREDEDMSQGDMIPGFGPDGQARDDFPLPRGPPQTKSQRRAEKRRARKARDREERGIDDRRRGNSQENNNWGEDSDMRREMPDRTDRDGRYSEDRVHQGREEEERLRGRDDRSEDRERRSRDMDDDQDRDQHPREMGDLPRDRERHPDDADSRPNDRDSQSRDMDDRNRRSYDMDDRSRDMGEGNRRSRDRNDHPPDSEAGPPHMDRPMSGHEERTQPNEERYHRDDPESMDYDDRNRRGGPGMMGPRRPNPMARGNPNSTPLGPRKNMIEGPRYSGMGPAMDNPEGMEERGPRRMDGPMPDQREGPPRMPGGPMPLMSLKVEEPRSGGDMDYRNSPGEEGGQQDGQGGRELPDSSRGMPSNQDHSNQGSREGSVGPAGLAIHGEETRSGNGRGDDQPRPGSDMDMRQGDPGQRDSPAPRGLFQGSNARQPQGNSRDGPHMSERGGAPPEDYSEANFDDQESFTEDGPPVSGSRYWNDNRGPEKRPWREGPGEQGFDQRRQDQSRGGRGRSRGGRSRGRGPRGGRGSRGGGFMSRGRGRSSRGGRGRGAW